MDTSDITELFKVETSSDWLFSAPDGDYKIHVSFYRDDIVHLDIIGYANLHNKSFIWPPIKKLIYEKLGENHFYLVHNLAQLSGSSPRARFDYINWIKREKDIIKGVYFYNVSSLATVMIKSGMLLVTRTNYVFVKKNLKEVFGSILEKENINYSTNKLDLTLVEDINFENWETNKTIVSKSGQTYMIRKEWIHKHEECQTITYLLNENILVRLYIGDFIDQTLVLTEKSLDDILIETNLKDQKFHFYIDFSKAGRISLKYRKDSVKWYSKYKNHILSSGLYHLSASQKFAVTIARSMAPEFIKQKVFVIDNAHQMFSVIEESYLNSKDNMNLRRQYRKMNKKQLINHLIEVKTERDTELNHIYEKLGRLSWDEDYQFENFEINDNDNSFSEIHNALRLVQEDLKDILYKRDHLIAKAKESDKLKSAFLANMSHEIRTPMNSIVGFSNLLLEMENLDQDAHDFSSVIHRNSRFLLELINDIIDLSKIEAGQLSINIIPIVLRELLDELMETLDVQKKYLLKPEVKLEMCNKIENKDFTLNSDPVRLKQILLNLLTNAMKFTKQGIIQLEIIEEPNSVKFEVKDTGIGISEDDISTLFTRFIRSKDKLKNNAHTGTGLGLYISKFCVDLLGGEINVKSEVGKGTSFCFYIPNKMI